MFIEPGGRGRHHRLVRPGRSNLGWVRRRLTPVAPHQPPAVRRARPPFARSRCTQARCLRRTQRAARRPKSVTRCSRPITHSSLSPDVGPTLAPHAGPLRSLVARWAVARRCRTAGRCAAAVWEVRVHRTRWSRSAPSACSARAIPSPMSPASLAVRRSPPDARCPSQSLGRRSIPLHASPLSSSSAARRPSLEVRCSLRAAHHTQLVLP